MRLRSCPRYLRGAALVGAFAAVSFGSGTGLGAAPKPLPAAPYDLGRVGVPEVLRPWVPWALEGQDDVLCPFVYNDAQTRRCVFASRLSLNVTQAGGDFTLEAEAYRTDTLGLPGDARHWPLDVRLDGLAAVVLERDDLPRVALSPGRHVITGRFIWQNLPEAVQLPKQLALFAMHVDGAVVPGALPAPDGRIWLRKSESAAEETGSVEVRIHRLVTDSIPVILRTHIALDVSGKNREVVLGPVLDGTFTPMQLTSPLPARLTEDGLLHVQVSPGAWNLYLDARHAGPATELSPPRAPKPWPEQEVWAVELRPDLRQATVEGVPAVDPAQTGLPEDWRKFPAYRVQAGDKLLLKELSRGDDAAAADQLTLARTWWLDFDGGGYTLQDAVSGTIKRSWRLDMGPAISLGRIAVDGRDQFITKLGDNGSAGVEIRRGELKLAADSRLEAPSGRLPAVGWDEDFQHVSGLLQLPPGWRLFAATGVDRATGTWIEAWALMDLFLLLIVSLATYRLAGRAWGALAFVTLALTITEDGAPRFLWLAGLLALALIKVLSPGRTQRLVQVYQVAVALVFAAVALPFMAEQIHVAVHACLERPGQAAVVARNDDLDEEEGGGGGLAEPIAAPSGYGKGGNEAAPMAPQAPAADGMAQHSGSVNNLGSAFRSEPVAKKPAAKATLDLRQTLNDYDPKAKVQTGPGLPTWRWRSSSLIWNGPVDRHQDLQLWLMPPWLNALLGLLRCLLVVLLIAVVMGYPPGAGGPAALRQRLRRLALASTPVVLAALFGGLGASPRAAAAELPGKELLAELKTRLLKAPDCLPLCAVSPRMIVEYDAAALRLRLEVDVATDVMVPLPGKAKEWSTGPVSVDGSAASALYRDDDGVLWVHLTKGVHQVVLAGPLAPHETVQLALPLKPKVVTASGTGWTLQGVHEDGLADDNLQLKRLPTGGAANTEQRLGTALPPFVQVERELVIDLSWQVRTRVVRLTPPDAAVVLRVPLLPGEAVTSAGVRTDGGAVLVNLAPGTTETSWTSVLAAAGTLTLEAPEGAAWMETWRLNVSPIWHFAYAGVPVLAFPLDADQRVPTWRPWPREKLTLTLTKPAGVDGQSLTLDGSTLTVKPGLRTSDVTLALSVRSSRGGQHLLTLPPGAALQAFVVDGKEQSLRLEGGKLSVPLSPGAEVVSATWREDGGIKTWFRVAPPDLGQPSVNANVQVEVPEGRWILWTSGPRMGPAVLYWGMLVFVLLVATALGSVPLTPLRTRDWFLLGLGLSQTGVEHALIIGGLFLALGWRRRVTPPRRPWAFNLMQLVLLVLAAASAVAIVDVIHAGFLGYPDMQIRGNASTGHVLRWYQDRTVGPLPAALVVSVPMLFYRLAMLAWALWLAQFLLKRVAWIWDSFGKHGFWVRPKRRPPPAAAAAEAENGSPFGSAVTPDAGPPPER